MPAQSLTERSSKGVMGLPANSSTVALMKKVDKQSVGLEVEFSGGERSDHVTPRQWITVCVLVYVNLINYMDRLTLAGIIEGIREEFSANNAMMGLLQTAFIISYMVFAPLFGYLGDRYSRKAIMAAGVFLWSVFTLIGSFISGKPENKDEENAWNNPDFWKFMACRAMVGIGEASYSTIAPTIISDMFVKNMRSKMLALFYFAIPVGSGLGYIVGAETARIFGDWHWGLRATPIAGIVATVLILIFLVDPPRGESEGHQNMQAQSYKEDIKSLANNKSFVFSTLAFTCVTFCTGALSWWGPDFIKSGLKTMKEEDRGIDEDKVELVFGVVTMMSGVVGVPLGMILSTQLKAKFPRADPVICATGILISALFLTLGMLITNLNIYACFACLFVGEVALNLNWSIVADMLLYIVTPTCRSTAEAIQILASHAFGDAGSPYLIGLVSDGLLGFLSQNRKECLGGEDAGECVEGGEYSEYKYQSLLYSLLTNCGVEVIGGILFLITAVYIVRDKLQCEKAAAGAAHLRDPGCGQRLMMTPTNYSPQDSLAEDLPSEDELPKLKLYITDELSSSRSPSP